MRENTIIISQTDDSQAFVQIEPQDKIVQFEKKRLLNIEAAAQLLADASTIEEITEVRSYAEAVRLVARQAKAGLEVQNKAAELKLRAERRAGEMLANMEKNKGGQAEHKSYQSNDTTTRKQPTLNDVGVSRDQSSAWQRIASIPEPEFEKHISETKNRDEELTTAGTVRLAVQLEQGADVDQSDGFNYKRDVKSNRLADEYTPQGYDACQTPPYAVAPVLPYLKRDWLIWEPAYGEGYLGNALTEQGYGITTSDILTGQNFFDYEPELWDVLVTNPPFSLKYKWMQRCYELGKPFALLLPVETLGAKTGQEMFREYGVQIILMDSRVNFKMPNKGWDGGGAQFPTAWFTWGLSLEAQLIFAKLNKNVEEVYSDTTI